MSETLKIYACSGIGDATYTQEYNYWLDNTKTINNTQAVNTLLANINSAAVDVLYLDLPEEKVLDKLQYIDLLCVCLYCAQEYSHDTALLHKAGQVIGSMYAKGKFAFNSFDNSERDANLDKLVKEADSSISGDSEYSAPSDFTEWWHKTIEERNKVGLNANKRKIIEKTLKNAPKQISGDWTDNADLQKYLFDGANYFIYCYFTAQELKQLPKVFTTKAAGQLQIYNYCKALFVDVYGSEEEMRKIIEAGIVKKCGDTPREICKIITNMPKKAKDYGLNGTKGVGLTPEVITAIISAIVTVVVALITSVCDCVKQINADKYQSVRQQTIDDSQPEKEDFSELDKLAQKKDFNKYIPYLIIGGAALLLFRK